MGVCGNCFRELHTEGPCPYCGWDGADQAKKYPLALHTGAILNGRYTIGRVLGQGGFGVTYIALDDQTKSRVAIKEYLPTELAGRVSGTYAVQVYSDDRLENFEYGKEQFLQEAKTLAAFIGDAHIVRIHSYFEENGTAYFVMDYVEGLPLDKYMAQHGGRLSPEEAGALLLPLMESLAHVHAAGIIHRDIAPDNILVQLDGTVKLIDFGAARYSTGEKSKSLDVILKHGFAPKEQYTRRGRQGPFTDVYAMGATFYYTITGRIPPEAIDRLDDDNLVPPSTLGVKISAPAEDVLLRALEINVQDRWQSMTAFRRAMEEALEPARPAEVIGLPSREAQLEAEIRKLREEKERLEREKESLRTEQERIRQSAAPAPVPASEPVPVRAPEYAEKKSEETAASQPADNAHPAPEKKRSKAPFVLGVLVCVVLLIFGLWASLDGRGFESTVLRATPQPTAKVRTNEDLTAELNGTALTISGNGAAENLGNLIPDWNEIKKTLTAVEVKEGITNLGDWIFSDCTSLENVRLPASLQSIGIYAFSNCSSLNSITFPEGLQRIENSAFIKCSKLKSVTFPKGLLSIGDSSFDGCSALSSVTLPKSLTRIGRSAFKDCIALSSVTIPEGVTSIGDFAFAYCRSLTSLTLPKSLTRIDGYAFNSCIDLTDVYYAGSKSDWEKIVIEWYAFPSYMAIHYNSK